MNPVLKFGNVKFSIPTIENTIPNKLLAAQCLVKQYTIEGNNEIEMQTVSK